MGSGEIGRKEPGLFRVEGKGEALCWWIAVLLPQCFMEGATLYNFDLFCTVTDGTMLKKQSL